jgi:molybdate transport system substrate-binding protein
MIKTIIAGLALASSLYAGSINIAVAANVSYAIDELKKEFNKVHPDTDVRVTLGSSGKLTAQIKNGAPYQLFMAANMKYPEALYEDGIAITKPVIYAQGSLAMLSNKKLDFSKDIDVITTKEVKKIAVANPKTAPYGKAAIEAIKNAKLYKDVEKKFVFAESISQTVSYAVTAADIGFIAKSSLYSPKMSHYKEGVNWRDVDPKLYTPINQGIVMLNKQDKEVKAFYDFMLGDKAKKILNDFGYLVP